MAKVTLKRTRFSNSNKNNNVRNSYLIFAVAYEKSFIGQTCLIKMAVIDLDLFFFLPYKKSFMDRAYSIKMAEYWPRVCACVCVFINLHCLSRHHVK